MQSLFSKKKKQSKISKKIQKYSGQMYSGQIELMCTKLVKTEDKSDDLNF